MRYLDSIFPILENSSDSEIKKFKEKFTESCFENQLAAILKCIVGNISERCGN